MSPMLKKQELVGIVQNLVGSLGNDAELAEFVQKVLNYQEALAQADELTSEQQEMVRNAQEYIEVQRNALVGGGILSEQAFSAIEPSESGGLLAKSLAIVQTLTGSSEVRRNTIKADRIPMILGGVAIPLVIVDGTTRYGVKSSGNGKKTANPDRPSVKALEIGLKHAIFWRYSKKWYEVFRSPSGYRVFDLNTREELTNPEELPETASGAQKLATSGWADAFRGYNAQLPEDADVSPLEAHEIS